MNILITITNLCFAAVLEHATSVDGPWSDVATSWSACPSSHTFNAPVSGPIGFYRIRSVDNGVVPTPYNLHVLVKDGTVHLSTARLVKCDDSVINRFRWYRNGVFIGEGTNEFVDNPGPGIYTYEVVAVDGSSISWISDSVWMLM